MKLKSKELFHELKHHLPLAFLAALIGIIIAFYLKSSLFNFNKLESSFEILHVLHIFASAIVSGGLFYRYKKNIYYSLLVGTISSVFVGSLSDVLFPFIGGLVFNFNISFHFPLIETPLVILSSGLIGSLIGITTGFTRLPHFGHVLVSSLASLFYLLTFTSTITLTFLIISLFITIIAVIIPCCFSDIILPFLFLGEKIKHCNCQE
jgi:hypothetical protein